VLFLLGNAGNISRRLDSIAIFRELGLDVVGKFLDQHLAKSDNEQN
jgi:hypothetical protein